ncbi:hypothetical protein E2C01_046643 [Portunus trituberculatus]|uniref:Uncharacterized protein n=1 Tax=Portunus trituberculatus TaxID=210409 RepID=A0A5B7G5N5_PORTR|nr:hypothetical protein [Portunus trituberculatus]
MFLQLLVALLQPPRLNIMAFSCPATLSEIENDLHPNSDDEAFVAQVLRPDMGRSSVGPGDGLPAPPRAALRSQASLATKHTMNDVSTSEESLCLASKTSRVAEECTLPQVDAMETSAGRRVVQLEAPSGNQQPQHVRPSIPAFASREDYVKLMFVEDPGVNIKLRWLTEITRAFNLDRELAEIKMSAETSRFVYVSRKRQDIVKSTEAGLDRKFSSFLVTRYPVEVEPDLSKELPGVHNARRFRQNVFCHVYLPARSINWIMTNQRVTDVGESVIYPDTVLLQSAVLGVHDSRSCQHRDPPLLPSPVTEGRAERPITPPIELASKWRCPRCQEPGCQCVARLLKTPTASSINVTLSAHAIHASIC